MFGFWNLKICHKVFFVSNVFRCKCFFSGNKPSGLVEEASSFVLRTAGLIIFVHFVRNAVRFIEINQILEVLLVLRGWVGLDGNSNDLSHSSLPLLTRLLVEKRSFFTMQWTCPDANFSGFSVCLSNLSYSDLSKKAFLVAVSFAVRHTPVSKFQFLTQLKNSFVNVCMTNWTGAIIAQTSKRFAKAGYPVTSTFSECRSLLMVRTLSCHFCRVVVCDVVDNCEIFDFFLS